MTADLERLEGITGKLTMVVEELSSRLESLEHLLPATSRGRLTRDAGLVTFELLELVTLQQLENAYIAYVLMRCDNNKTSAANVLGIDASTLYRKLERL